MAIIDELNQLLNGLRPLWKDKHKNLHALETTAEEVGKSWSGSWIGYQSRVYYKNFTPPPAGAHFSIEWGFVDACYSNDTRGNWLEYKYDEVIKYIHEMAGVNSIAKEERECNNIKKAIDKAKIQLKSIISGSLRNSKDECLKELLEKVYALKIFSSRELVQSISPNGQIISRDMLALGQGIKTPPHLAVYVTAMALLGHYAVLQDFIDVLQQIIAHVDRIFQSPIAQNVGEKVFIGHGRSLQWMKLKDFIVKLGLSYEEFNRVPVAGITNVARLEEMLNNAKFAFLVMTAEDERKDGSLQPRMNVIHEVGLFQGRLGFSHAIVILEDGCKEFTNIQGLGQIRFSKGDISTCFEQIRETLRYHAITDN